MDVMKMALRISYLHTTYFQIIISSTLCLSELILEFMYVLINKYCIYSFMFFFPCKDKSYVKFEQGL